MSACIFCQIVAGAIPAQRLAETESTLAFRDLHAQAPLHALVIPKQHFSRLTDVPETELSLVTELYRTARKVASEAGLSERGYRLVMNVGAEGGQSVFHVHLHVLGGKTLGPGLAG